MLKSLSSKQLITSLQYYFRTARGPLIETHELHELIKQKKPLKILQAGFLMPNQQGETNSVYQKERIPGTQLFDLKGIFDQNAKYPHTLASMEQFANYMKTQNLKKKDTFVVYDDFGVAGATRVWWTFQIFGIRNVYVLNGSSIKWKNEKLPLEVSAPKSVNPAKKIEKFVFNPSLVIDINQVKQISKQILSNVGGFEIVDARSPGRFNGTEPEPRAGIRSGNIPGSKNVFFKDTVNADWSFKSNAELKKLFEGKGQDYYFSINNIVLGINLKNRIINSCGSGMTASVINFAEELIGVKDKAIYDGSWSEFGSVPL